MHSDEFACLATAIPGALGTSFAATLQHVALLKEREERLEAARHDAENQMLHRVGLAYHAGEIDEVQLKAVYDAYNAVGTQGRSSRWNEHIKLAWAKVRHAVRIAPNGPEETWIGSYPCDRYDPAPMGGVSVVYVLFDDTNTPCYVGSSAKFRQRLKDHAKAGKRFVRWQAHRCRDREHAYALEGRLLREHKPYLNRRTGR